MHLFKTKEGIIIKQGDNYYNGGKSLTDLINHDHLHKHLAHVIRTTTPMDNISAEEIITCCLLAPVDDQEIWAAGVTYLKSRDARMEESKDSGGADCYQKVYDAERPELFFKSMAHRVAGPAQEVYIRKDSKWNVPEPELTLYMNSKGKIEAYTVGNDMSSRSIEGENPLYLPQAKVYERSAALGPCLYVPASPPNPETKIHMRIYRRGEIMYDDETPISRIKRKLDDLAAYLFRACRFKQGCFLMTGTCLVPSSDFTLASGDVVDITIDGIGTLSNVVAVI